MDERKLRLYKFLVKMGRIVVDVIPEPYRSAIINSKEDTYEKAIFKNRR